MANNVDPDLRCSGSTLFASILNLSVMLANYLQQTTSADGIFNLKAYISAYEDPLPSYPPTPLDLCMNLKHSDILEQEIYGPMR